MEKRDLQLPIGSTGTITVDIVDLDNLTPTTILDRSLGNGVRVAWQVKGTMAGVYSLLDSFNLSAHLENIAGGPNYTFNGPAIPVGHSQLVGQVADFPVPANPNDPLFTVQIPANTVTPGIYRMTILLTHNPTVPLTRMHGFVDGPVVEFF